MRTNSVLKAAKAVGMNESTAKSIYYKYKKSGNFLRKNTNRFVYNTCELQKIPEKSASTP